MSNDKKLRLLTPEAQRELTLIQRRAEFLELRANPHLWKYRQQEIEAAYADVKDGIGIQTDFKRGSANAV